MQKDFKIGILAGVLLAVVVCLWISTRKQMSIKSRMLRLHSGELTDTNASPRAGGAADVSRANKSAAKVESSTDSLAGRRIHIVQNGQSLSEISVLYFGSASNWPKILEANRKIIKNPDKLIPGTRLVIPD